MATPLTAATLVVPARVPPPGFVRIARVTVAVLEVTTRLAASSIDTLTGAIEAPWAVVVGWLVKTSWLAGPTALATAGTSEARRAAPAMAPMNPRRRGRCMTIASM